MTYRQSIKPEVAWEACRSMHLHSLSHAADAMAVEKALSEATGVIQIRLDLEKKCLKVLYNATVTSFASISELLEETGFPPDDSRWSRIRAGWYAFLDENARTNARAHAPPCCNKPPK
jgi:copper chaperone CopZ